PARMKRSGPRLLGDDDHLVGEDPHPALVPPDGDGWQQWAPPAGGWRALDGVQRSPVDAGVEQITAVAVDAQAYIRIVFAAASGERFWGFGERSDTTERSGLLTEHWVGEGPYQLAEYPLIESITRRWAIRRRRDATYYPIPWLLSSAGYGVLTD